MLFDTHAVPIDHTMREVWLNKYVDTHTWTLLVLLSIISYQLVLFFSQPSGNNTHHKSICINHWNLFCQTQTNWTFYLLIHYVLSSFILLWLRLLMTYQWLALSLSFDDWYANEANNLNKQWKLFRQPKVDNIVSFHCVCNLMQIVPETQTTTFEIKTFAAVTESTSSSFYVFL